MKRRLSCAGAAVALFLLGAVLCGSCHGSEISGAAGAVQKEGQTMFSEAEAYERFMGRWSRLLAPSMVEFSNVHDGNTVLDVGCGTGALALAVQDTVKDVDVTGIDFSAAYITSAKEQNTDHRVHFATGDAQALGFPDAQFDRTMSLLVVNFIPDRDRALKEMIRVTKPGGIVSAAVWDYGEGMQMLRVFWDEAGQFDADAMLRDEAHMPLCKQGELRAAWRNAGLQDVEEISLSIPLRFASFGDYWEPFLLGQGPAGAYVAHLPSERQDELGRRLRHRLLGTEPDHPIELTARAWAVRGTKALANSARS
jgi:SAM-dependent methyltransferase